jgi:GH35 family endo-1,4-beta-xylanase
MTSEHASKTAVKVATKKPSPVATQTAKKAAKATKPAVVAIATGGHGQPSKSENSEVHVRHMRKPRNAWILIKNTSVFGTMDNWATKDEFETAEAAAEWAKKHGLKVANR